jgi:hypothetical protein
MRRSTTGLKTNEEQAPISRLTIVGSICSILPLETALQSAAIAARNLSP